MHTCTLYYYSALQLLHIQKLNLCFLDYFISYRYSNKININVQTCQQRGCVVLVSTSEHAKYHVVCQVIPKFFGAYIERSTTSLTQNFFYLYFVKFQIGAFFERTTITKIYSKSFINVRITLVCVSVSFFSN